PVQGTRLLSKLRSLGIGVPMVGIGGITAARPRGVVRAGADGVAVSSAVTGVPAGEVRTGVKGFLTKIREAL
ncbi:thiamine phosphate synthase, partial [Clostridium perfringens]